MVEFSLLGERHALPKLEVEEVIACKPWRAFPDVPPIVLGVAEHNGEILPVVDLAMMFGRLSLVTPAWRMMLVNNGDFRALVITETVFRERRLAPDIHRAVPIHLPHNLMYGCYPDAEAVRLILNVEAISVHFEKSLIQQFLPALSQEMKMMSAPGRTCLRDRTSSRDEPAHEVEPAAALSAAGPEALAAQEQASVQQPADEPVQELQQQTAKTTSSRSQSRKRSPGILQCAPEPEPQDAVPVACVSRRRAADTVIFGRDGASRTLMKRVNREETCYPENDAEAKLPAPVSWHERAVAGRMAPSGMQNEAADLNDGDEHPVLARSA